MNTPALEPWMLNQSELEAKRRVRSDGMSLFEIGRETVMVRIDPAKSKTTEGQYASVRLLAEAARAGDIDKALDSATITSAKVADLFRASDVAMHLLPLISEKNRPALAALIPAE